MEAIDREILGWIGQRSGDPALAAQLAAATTARRDYMRTGFFVYFDVPDTIEKVPSGVRPVCPHIESAELMDGAGCSLFLRNGRLHYLEVYARGGFMPESLADYRLTESPD